MSHFSDTKNFVPLQNIAQLGFFKVFNLKSIYFPDFLFTPNSEFTTCLDSSYDHPLLPLRYPQQKQPCETAPSFKMHLRSSPTTIIFSTMPILSLIFLKSLSLIGLRLTIIQLVQPPNLAQFQFYPSNRFLLSRAIAITASIGSSVFWQLFITQLQHIQL